MSVKDLKPELKQIKPADTLEQGQRILANMIAGAYLRSKKDNLTEIRLNKTKDKEV